MFAALLNALFHPASFLPVDAQDNPDRSQSTQNEDDPLATDPTYLGLGRTPTSPHISVPDAGYRGGATFAGRPSAKMTEHVLTVQLELGGARLIHAMTLKSPDSSAVGVTLSLPKDAVLTSLVVEPVTAEALCAPGQQARQARDKQVKVSRQSHSSQWALVVATPPGLDTFRLCASFVAAVTRNDVEYALELPPYAADPRRPLMVLRVEDSLGARGVSINDAKTLADTIDPEVRVRIVAKEAARKAARVWHTSAPCGAHLQCLWSGSYPPSRHLLRDRFVLMLDVSPSTAGDARGDFFAAVSALLGQSAPSAQLAAFAFAGRATAVVPAFKPASQTSLTELSSIELGELGAVTRVEAAWNAVKELRGSKPNSIVLFSDGGLTVSDDQRRAFREILRADIPVYLVHLGRDALRPELRALALQSGGLVLDSPKDQYGELGDRWARSMAPYFATQVRVAGRTVSSILEATVGNVTVGRGVNRPRHRGTRVATDFAWLALTHGSGAFEAPFDSCGDTELASLEATDQQLRTTCTSRVPGQARPGAGVPAETLLSLLRARVIPKARGCFRDDRRGQRAYSRRAVMSFRLAEREVTAMEVKGELSGPLRQCLSRALDDLEVPSFEGVVTADYPLTVEAAPNEPVLHLTGDLEQRLDALFDERANSFR